MSRTGESSPDETLTKQERAYRTIRERILSGEYGPGHRVVIGSLATELGVSALPVREAIRRLEAEGLVVFRPNAGAHVAPADPFVFEEEMTVLAVLEGYATGLAAPFVGDEDVVRLEAITDAMEAAVERLDTLGFGRLNQEFHEVIYERCPNAALVELLPGRRAPARRDPPDRLRADPVPRRRVRRRAPGPDRARSPAARAPIEIEAAARGHKLGTVESFRAWRAEHEVLTGSPAVDGSGGQGRREGCARAAPATRRRAGVAERCQRLAGEGRLEQAEPAP